MITPWYGERLRSFDRFNALMDQMLGEVSNTNGFAWSPNVDVKETETEYTFHAELPGMKLDDVHVDFSGNTLTISGCREAKTELKNDNYIRRERSFGKFQRAFTLEGTVKPDAIHANFKDGILNVVVPRTAVPNHKRIPVKAG